MENDGAQAGYPEDGITILEVFAALWENRKRLIAIGLLGALLLGGIAFKLPKAWTSEVLLVPTEKPSTDQLGALSSLIGKKASTGLGDVDLYNALLTSRTVLQQLLVAPIQVPGERRDARPLWSILEVDTSDSKAVRRTMLRLKKDVVLQSEGNSISGIMSVAVTAKEPWLAKQMADALVAIGLDELRRVSVERLTTQKGRLDAVAKDAKSQAYAAALRVTRFQDANRSIMLPSQQLELGQLLLEKQVQEQKYLMARKEVEDINLQIEKLMPPVVVMDPADLPSIKSKPKRLFLVIGGGGGFFLLGCLWVVLRLIFRAEVSHSPWRVHPKATLAASARVG